MASTTTSKALVGSPRGLGRRSEARGQWALAWDRLRRSRGAVIGGTVAAALILIAVLSPWIAPYDPIETAPKDRLLGPSLDHPFGTDKLGRDIFSRVIAPPLAR
jgi:peptide/nickel transport system permease protein